MFAAAHGRNKGGAAEDDIRFRVYLAYIPDGETY